MIISFLSSLFIIHGFNETTHPADACGWKGIFQFFSFALGCEVVVNFCPNNYFQIEDQRTDPRLHHPRQNSEVTKYMDVAWRVKEQSENMN